MTIRHSLRALQAFEAAARRGSFVLAADELGVSPAAVSQLIRGLEAQIGRLLFVREKRGIQLSEAGQETLPRLTSAFHDIRETTEMMSNHAVRPQLVVSVPASVATGWLPRKLPTFLKAEPGVNIRLREDQDPIDLEAERIDLRLSYSVFPQNGVQIIAEMPDTAVAVCTPQYLGEHQTKIASQPLSAKCFIQTDWGQASARFPTWSEFLGKETKQPTHTVSSSHAALVLARAGVGVALVQLLYAAEFLRSGELVFAHSKRMAMPQKYCVSVRTQSATRPLIQRFADWFVTQIQKEAELPC